MGPLYPALMKTAMGRSCSISAAEETSAGIGQIISAVRRRATPLPGFALHPPAPAVRLDNGFGNRQPQTEAAAVALARFVRAIEPLEDARQIFLRDTGAGVGDINQQPVVRGQLQRADCSRIV